MSNPFRSFRPIRPAASARLHIETLEGRIQPATFNIANGDVSGLVAAIITANTNGEADTINLAANGTFTLTAINNTAQGSNGLPVVQADGGNGLTINGNGATIERDAAAPNMRVLEVNNGVSPLTMTGVTIRGGKDPGNDGGGIRLDSNANLTLSTSKVQQNTITSGNRGGGIGAMSHAALTISDSVISGNSTNGRGGGLSVYGLSSSTASLTMQNSQISGNTSSSHGGGAFLYNSSVTIQNSTISGNTSSNRGGGLELYKTTGLIQNSTISGNSTSNRGGGLFLYKGTNTLANTTISGNTTTGGSGFGGGVTLYKGTQTLVNCTITGNTASQQGGGIYIESSQTTANVQNTIVAGNTDINGANDVYRTSGTLNASNTLFQTIAGGTINGTNVSNLTGVDPLLGSLQDNGGPTKTHLLLSGSPAINAGDPSFASSLNADQRGKARTAGGQIDLGALEVQPPIINSTSSSLFTVGTSGTFTVTTSGDRSITLSVVGTLPGGVTFLDNGNGTATLAGTPVAGTGGTYTFTISAANGISPNATQSFTLSVYQAPVPPSPSPSPPAHSPEPLPQGQAVGTLEGGMATIRTFAADGSPQFAFIPFDGFAGSITVARGDFDRDGVSDILVGAGAGADPHIAVFSGVDGHVLFSFDAFDSAYRGGASVATGDVNGDGTPDLVVGSLTTSSHVKVFSGVDGSEITSFFAFDNFQGGVNVAAADLNGDGFADVIIGTQSGTSHVKAIDARNNNWLASFFAFDYNGGVSVAAGGLNGGPTEIVVGSLRDASHVKVFNGNASEQSSFFVFDNAKGGVSVAVFDADGDGHADIGVGSRVGSHVKAFHFPGLDEIDSFYSQGGNYSGGIDIG